MAFGENPTPIETVEEQTPEQELSNTATNLHNELSKLATDNYIKIPEGNGSQTRLKSSSININSLYEEGYEGPKTVGPEIIFSLENMEGPEGNKKYNIVIDSYGNLTVNGDNIPKEKAMDILQKVESNIKQYKEYKIKQEQDIKKQKEEENKEQIEKENTNADKYINSIDF